MLKSISLMKKSSRKYFDDYVFKMTPGTTWQYWKRSNPEDKKNMNDDELKLMKNCMKWKADPDSSDRRVKFSISL